MCGETRIPRDMCAGNTLPGETYITVTLESTLVPLRESLEMMHENFDVLHPDGEKSQI